MPPDLTRQTRDILRVRLRWENVLESAWQHGVAPLLYRHLKLLAEDGLVPSEIRRKLLQLYHRTAYQNLHLLKALQDVLERFSRAGVKVIVLKGAALARLVYTDFALRPFFDLDLLIQKPDLSKARDLLLEAGYDVLPGLLSERLCSTYHFNLPFMKREQNIIVYVELHWNIIDQFKRYTIDIDGLWKRACHAGLSHRDALVFSPEDIISHLSLHLDMHGYLNQAVIGRGDELRFILDPISENRLIWFTDLYEFIGRHRNSIDWASVVEWSKKAGTDGSIASTLTLLNILFGPVVDPHVLKQFKSPRPTVVKRGLLKWLTNSANADAAESAARSYFQRKLLPKRREVQFRLVRLMDLWEYTFPPFDLFRRRDQSDRRSLLVLPYLVHVLTTFFYFAGFLAQLLFCLLKKPVEKFLGRSLQGAAWWLFV